MYAKVHIILSLADLWNASGAYARTRVLDLFWTFCAPMCLAVGLPDCWVANHFATFRTDHLREALVLCSMSISHRGPHVNDSSVLLTSLIYHLQLQLASLYLIVYLLSEFLSFFGAGCVDTVYVGHLVNCLIE